MHLFIFASDLVSIPRFCFSLFSDQILLTTKKKSMTLIRSNIPTGKDSKIPLENVPKRHKDFVEKSLFIINQKYITRE